MNEELREREVAKRVNYLRLEGFTMAEQVKASDGRGKHWVEQTHKILKLQPKIVKAYLDNKINRTVALHLAALDTDKRLAAFEATIATQDDFQS